MPESLEQKTAEFEQHLWDHTTDPFQMAFDRRAPFTGEEAAFLSDIVAMICERQNDTAMSSFIRDRVRAEPELIHPVLQVAGLTRNKVLVDLKAGTRGGDVRIPGDVRRLPVNDGVWAVTSRYLLPRLRVVLQPLCNGNQYGSSLESLNQATWPGWIRQERAKRQGHEAEHRLAILLRSLDLPFEPQSKAENPLTRDAQIHGVSFDLVAPLASEPVMCVKATVHTANIGQYGESKDKMEIEEAAEMLRRHFGNDAPALVALIDGIGFRSNRAGLNGVLEGADEFCQFQSIWKAAAVAASRLGRSIAVALPSDDVPNHKAFLARYGEYVITASLSEAPHHSTQAGEALVWMS